MLTTEARRLLGKAKRLLIRILLRLTSRLWLWSAEDIPFRAPTSRKRRARSVISKRELYRRKQLGVAALENVDIVSAIRFLAPVATASCNDSDIDRLRAKEEACYYLAIALLQGLGRLDEAVLFWRERKHVAAAIIRYYRSKHCLLHDPRDLYFDEFWSSVVGHTALLGIYVKKDILEGHPYRSLTLLRPPDANRGNGWLVSRWKQYVTLADSHLALPFSAEQSRYMSKNIFLEERLLGPETYFWQAYAEISRAWELAGRGPLMKLSESEIRSGTATLTAMGIPPGAHYVCLHVRSAGFKSMHDGLQAALNADIATYDLSIDSITRRGYWVIRMGDASMPKLPAADMVVDYAHSPHKKDWMDVFLCATCRFYVGTSSGLGYVPNLFGIPSVFTNWFPTGTRPLNSADIFIPKTHWYDRQYDFAPFAESMAPPFGHIHAETMLRKAGVSLRNNTPGEICDVVQEMMDRLEGKAIYSAEDKRLQSQFDAVANSARSFGNAHIGRDFIRKYRRLLPPECPQQDQARREPLQMTAS